MVTPSNGAAHSPAAPAFAIAVPGDWMIIDLELAQREDVIDALIEKRVAEGVLSPESRHAAAAAMARVAHQAVEEEMRFAAVLVTEHGGWPTAASVTVATAFAPPDAEESGETGEATTSAENRNTAWFGRSEASGRGSSEQVVLPAGPAVRVERTISVPLTDTFSQDVYSVQYVVPVNEEGSALVITGTSSAIRRKDDLDRIFREIAESLDIERPG